MFLRDPNSSLPHPHFDDLRQLPEHTIAELVAFILSEVPHVPHTLGLELRPFVESRTVIDARRVSGSLRHVYGRPGLAQDIDDALSD